MKPSDSVPFTVEPLDERRVRVRFSAICDQARTKEHDDELQRLVERFDVIAADLTENTALSSNWVRWLGRMTTKADRAGKSFVIVGPHENFKVAADVLALQDTLHTAETLEGAWTQ